MRELARAREMRARALVPEGATLRIWGALTRLRPLWAAGAAPGPHPPVMPRATRSGD